MTIANGEGGASVRAKINQAFSDIQTLSSTTAEQTSDILTLQSDAAKVFSDVASLLADTALGYSQPAPNQVVAGNIITARGFRYEVAASGATDEHITTAGGVKLYVVTDDGGFNVKAFGAMGDGTTDDTDAFALASSVITAADGGKLVIPSGTYIVGRQTFAGAGGLGYAYRPADIIKIENCTKPVVVELQGAVLRHPNGLRFGSFNPVTGAAHTPVLPFTDINYAADPGIMMRFQNNSGGVSIVGRGELDGNNINMIIGGQWGDTGYQRLSHGLWEYNNDSFYAENVYAHHFGTDGIVCGYTGAVAGGPTRPKTLINIVSEYNGRQGLSWVGGIGLTAINCKFNRSGRAINAGTGVALASSPGAGVDIEAESAVCRNGVFINCEAINNVNTAVVADSGDSADVQFISCTFGGTVWPRKPGFKFDQCKFYGVIVNQFGSLDPSQATSFRDCLFTDVQIDDYTVPVSLGANAFQTSMTTPTYYTGCQFTYTRMRPGRFEWFVMRDCRVAISFGTTAVDNRDYVATLGNATLENCTFDANITVNAPADGYYLGDIDTVRATGRNLLTNTAGILRWTSWSTGAGGYVGLLGNTGRQEGVKNGSNALSIFPNNWFSQYYGTLDIYAGTAAPVSGTYKRGDRVINQSPTVGQPKGWICTVAGTPGTWVSEGNL